MKLWLDLETYSLTPLRSGTHIYAEPAEIMLVTYAVDDGEVYEWDRTAGDAMPMDLDEALDDADELWWQNGNMFDYTLLRNAAPELLARMPLSKWRDTMLQAYEHSLPGKLDLLCQIFKIPLDQSKDKRGSALIQLFCKPRRDGSRATRLTHPTEWAEFVEYAKSDIRAMRAVHAKMPKWNYPNNKTELALSHLDVQINQRGMQMDVELARAAVQTIDRAQKDLASRTVDLTDGEVTKATQRDKLLKHLLAEYDVDLPDLKKSTLERRINDPDLPDVLRELLAIRLEATMTSSSKYKTLLRGVSHDGRLRGLQQFCGANRTGRVAHRLYQPGNMPRPNVGLMARELGVAKLEDEDKLRYTAMGIDALKSGCADLIFENVMGLTSNIVRGSIIAPEGKKLVVSDLSNIEGRVAAFLAGEQWKLDAFRAYDAGTGADLYKLAYAKSFGVTVGDVDKEKRQLGKVQELALGYEGGVGAFVTFTMTYKMELDDVAAAVFKAIDIVDPEIVREARGAWQWASKKKRTLGLEEHVYVACDILKRGWRHAHSAISAFWPALKDGAVQAICSPGTTVRIGTIIMRRDGQWLRVQMPSGRQLCYIAPQVDDSGGISYMGVNQYTRKWQRVKTYGGKIFENLCQAVARDILFYNMPLVEDAGYEIVLSIHDELITEAPAREEFSDRHLSELISTVPEWAQGIPLSAGGFEATRYRKD
ncbi:MULTISPECIES: DNA polymerase I [unclassified Caballeronia]|uniref:DNA polymerase I n=1 Tax=unclassified Caballeronia TaxID=2646786 RepID=UPI00285F7538|nr:MULTISPECIES: DNA polymerase I [unclassified Caballeronia]MDR5772105.1 DNA polymerase I [Caballeronia sp. LZ002]MDR5847539.1 DNA polymerase I [Caballeronia sp. LZ003]